MKKLEKVLLIVVISIVVCVALFFIVLLIIALCQEDNTEAAKKEFSKYYNGKDEVVGICHNTLYFEEYSINLNDLIEKEDPGGLIVKNDRMLFTTSKQDSMSNYSLNIYESDLTGEEINLLFTKNEYKTNPIAYSKENIFYIEHYLKSAFDDSSMQIDTYNTITGEYKNIASGKDVSLWDYKTEEESIYDYSIIENKSSKKRGLFKIRNTVTNQEKIIDDNFLSETEYIDSLNKFKYSPDRVDISNGHILLTYSMGVSPWHYTQLIFEYDFEEETLEYKCLIFPDEVGPSLDNLYIGV